MTEGFRGACCAETQPARAKVQIESTAMRREKVNRVRGTESPDVVEHRRGNRTIRPVQATSSPDLGHAHPTTSGEGVGFPLYSLVAAPAATRATGFAGSPG
ncbi:MAG: hypothetical protein IT190_04910 [Microbacteriaceae bacterium]|nr:hypothetical protein [Microbacteriaceae bacterium]